MHLRLSLTSKSKAFPILWFPFHDMQNLLSKRFSQVSLISKSNNVEDGARKGPGLTGFVFLDCVIFDMRIQFHW